MSKELYQQANHLPAIEKLRLVELLLADLDTSGPGYDIIWRDEAQKRWQAYQAGELKAVSYDAVMQKYKVPSTY
ncbi:MAG: addiction module protein [Methylobacter tundripaludum]|nr:addiction module protein [Methylobacter tundripaludum]